MSRALLDRIGFLLRDPEAVTDANCNRFGQSVKRSDRFCRQCGRELPADPSTGKGEPP